MFKFFDQIINFIKIAVSFILNFLKQLVALITGVASAFKELLVAVNYMPAYVGIFISGFIVVGIIYFLVNRDG